MTDCEQVERSADMIPATLRTGQGMLTAVKPVSKSSLEVEFVVRSSESIPVDSDSQNFSVLSIEPVIIKVPLGDDARHRTRPRCPEKAAV